MSSIVSSVTAWLNMVYYQLTDGQSSLATAGVLGTAIILLAMYWTLRPRDTRKSPPGPLIPVASRISKVDLIEMETLIKKYGTIFGFRIMKKQWVFLCDVDVIKEALVGQPDLFSGRMNMPLLQMTSKGCGVIFIDGPKWQEHRRFILTVLRSFGFGKNITERIIQEELEVISEEFSKLNGKPYFPRLTLLRSAANIICLLVFGERCGDEPGFELLVRVASGITSPTARGGLLAAILWKVILKLPGDFFGLKKYLEDNKKIEQYLTEKIEQHRKTIDWDNERDLIDAYLVEMRKRAQESPEQTTFTELQVVRVVLELFIAGMETTGNTVTWALYLMAKYPEIQRRVQQEIDSVIGEKMPQPSDRSKLVYTTAVLHEVERYATVSPFAVPHRTYEDTELRGYFLPKNTIVMPYLFGAHRDERIWKNPKKFDPSHFFDESTKSLINLSNLIPFSVGKRACLGESLATQELFVMFAGLLQRFRFDADPSQPLPEVTEDIAALPFRTAMEYKVVINPRTNRDDN